MIDTRVFFSLLSFVFLSFLFYLFFPNFMKIEFVLYIYLHKSNFKVCNFFSFLLLYMKKERMVKVIQNCTALNVSHITII